MVASQLRAKARELLSGKWGKAALITLCYYLIIYGISFLQQIMSIFAFIISIASLIIQIPITYGILVSFIKLKRNEEVGNFSFFANGFSQFKKVWGIYGRVLLKLIVPIIIISVSIFVLLVGTVFMMGSSLFTIHNEGAYTNSMTLSIGFTVMTVVVMIVIIVSEIYLAIKSLYYSLVFYLLYDNPDMSSLDIVNKSESLMKGNRWNLFYLELTFIGWSILSVFTLGIGILWLYPYVQITKVCFYEKLINKETSDISKINKAEENDI